MQVVTLDNIEYDWKLHKTPKKAAKSSTHIAVREMLVDMFATMVILEEVPVKVLKRKTLYFDFYIPLLNLAIEIHGEQHFSFNHHFFTSQQDFIDAQKNDNYKREWCELNNIKLIELNHKEKQDEWRHKIIGS
jgi:hypothetical protein